MTKSEQVCAYLEAMAKKAGGDVIVFQNDSGSYTMQRRGNVGADRIAFKVKPDEPREKFNGKVQRLMEGVSV